VKNKKWLFLLIIALPSIFWLILETSTIHSRRLPVYGPKKALGKGDTSYHHVTDRFYAIPDSSANTLRESIVSRNDYPLYAIIFLSEKYRKDAYRIGGLWEYLNYKKEKIELIPFVLVTEYEAGKTDAHSELKKLSEHKNVHFYTWHKNSFDSLVKTYFNQKPYYVDYSFFALVDPDRRIRGYYDGRYVSELKRLIEEYQHLRLKEEKQKLIETNEIKKNP
jgi:hypothetical protein